MDRRPWGKSILRRTVYPWRWDFGPPREDGSPITVSLEALRLGILAASAWLLRPQQSVVRTFIIRTLLLDVIARCIYLLLFPLIRIHQISTVPNSSLCQVHGKEYYRNSRNVTVINHFLGNGLDGDISYTTASGYLKTSLKHRYSYSFLRLVENNHFLWEFLKEILSVL